MAWWFFQGRPVAQSKESIASARCVRTNTTVSAGGGYVIYQETVLDERTGLEWERATSETQWLRHERYDHCNDLSIAGGGWRLPSMNELYSLVDVERTNPAIDVEAFPDTMSARYWVRDIIGGDNTGYVDFSDGRAGATDAPGSTSYVRCVRGGCANGGHSPVESPPWHFSCGD